MPNIKSAKKRVLVIDKKTLRNQMIKSALKTALKRFDVALSSGDKDAVKASFVLAVKKLDQAAAKGVIHANNASRKKAQLTLKLNAAR